MMDIYELGVYKLSEQLSDLIWYGIDTVFQFQVSSFQYQRIRSRFFDILLTDRIYWLIQGFIWLKFIFTW